MKRNNSFSETEQDDPKVPGGFTGGSSDFGIIRAVDGHSAYNEDDPTADRSNCHYPNGDSDGEGEGEY